MPRHTPKWKPAGSISSYDFMCLVLCANMWAYDLAFCINALVFLYFTTYADGDPLQCHSQVKWKEKQGALECDECMCVCNYHNTGNWNTDNLNLAAVEAETVLMKIEVLNKSHHMWTTSSCRLIIYTTLQWITGSSLKISSGFRSEKKTKNLS